MTDSSNALRLSLLENAYDSFTEALSYVAASDDDQSRWKFALLNLVHAVELVLKQRLANEHALLIWQDVDRPGRMTVGLEKAISRLVSAGVGLDDHEVRAIQTAIRWRNSVTHYEVDLLADEIRSNFLIVFEFLDRFHAAHFDSSLSDHIPEPQIKTAMKLASQFEREFVEFHGETMHRSWPFVLVAAQSIRELKVDGTEYARVRWGDEHYWSMAESRSPQPEGPCHDCGAAIGSFHGPACDMEQCPVDRKQLLSCDHDFDSYELWELEDEGISSLESDSS